MIQNKHLQGRILRKYTAKTAELIQPSKYQLSKSLHSGWQ